MQRRFQRNIGLGVGITMLALSLPSLTAAQGEPMLLNEGPWVGHMSLRGNAVGTIDGAPTEFRIDTNGVFDLDISGGTVDEDDRIGNEEAFVAIEGGSWTLDGTWQLDVIIPGAGSGIVDASINAAGGFDGTPGTPIHTGSLTSSGTITSYAAGVERTIAMPARTDPIRLEVQLQSSSCYEVYGDVSITLTEIIEQQGLNASFVGPWSAYRNTTDISAAIAEWVAEMRRVDHISGKPVAYPPNTPAVVRMFGDLLQQYNDWADTLNAQPELPQGSDSDLWRQTSDMINDHAVFIARLRNLTDCERDVIDPELIQKFDTIIKRALLLSAERLITNAALNIDKLTVLTKVALFSGALGASGPQPEAARIEEQLRVATEAILESMFISGAEDGTGVDGLDLTNPDTAKALALATSMRWKVTISGKEHDAAKLWDRYQALQKAEESEGSES